MAAIQSPAALTRLRTNRSDSAMRESGVLRKFGKWVLRGAIAVALCGGEVASAFANVRAVEADGVAGRCVVLPGAFRSMRAAAGGPVAARVYSLLMLRVVFASETGNPVGTMFGEAGLGLDETKMLAMQVDDFFWENSAGLVQFAPTFTEVLTLPKTKAAYGAEYLELVGDAKLVAKAAGFDADAFGFAVILAPLAEFPYAGISGGSWIHINGAFVANIVVHELGHSFGMGHSAAWASNTSDPLAADGRRIEYGNPFDPMGQGYDAAQHFSAIWKKRAGWWSEESVQRVTTSGTARVQRYDHFQASGVRALVIPAGEGCEYWVSVARNHSASDFEIRAAPRDGVLIYRLNTAQPGLEMPELIRPTDDGDDADDFFSARFVPGMSLIDASHHVKITIVGTGGASPNEWADVKIELNHAPALAFALEPVDTTLAVGRTLTLRAAAEVAATWQWRFNGVPLSGETSSTLAIATAQVANSGSYSVDATAGGQTLRSREAKVVIVDAPAITFETADQAVAEKESGARAYLGFRTVARNPSGGRWFRDGVEAYRFTYQANGAYTGNESGAGWNAEGGDATFFDSLVSFGWMTPSQAGFYSYVETNAAGVAESVPLSVGLRSHKKVLGDAVEFRSDITHPNGNVYDQLLMTGRAATFRADPGQVTRCSFIDLNDDIVQVEFSGRGNLTLVLDGTSGPARPVNYNQAVEYVKGHATIVIVGADATTNLSVFSVGRANAIDESLFRADVAYDGVADIQAIGVQSGSGRFGGIRAGNAELWGTLGWVGINATRVSFEGPVRIGNMSARDDAEPMLRMEDGERAVVEIAGGDLRQENGRAIHLDGAIAVMAIAGETSSGEARPAQVLSGTFRSDRR